MMRGSLDRLEIVPNVAGVADVAVRQAEVDGVEHVEDVPPQRRREALTETDLALQRQIEVLEARTGQPVAQLVAERAGRHGLKRGDVEPLIHRLRTASGRRRRSAGPVMFVPTLLLL